MNATKPMNPVRPINYFSLDLELNNKSDGTTPRIIEVGVAFGSSVRPEEITRYNWYLDPEEKITDFISNLTGITDEIIKEKSVPLSQVAEELGNLLTQEKPFVNPITWGGNDAAELLQEFRDGGISFPFFGRRILDVKTLFVYTQMVNGKSPAGSLKKSMRSYGLEFIGENHRADVDAYNTLRFFFYFLERQRIFENYKELMKEMK